MEEGLFSLLELTQLLGKISSKDRIENGKKPEEIKISELSSIEDFVSSLEKKYL